MNDRTRNGLAVLEAALIIGPLGDVLLRAIPWGVNVTLMAAVILSSVIILASRSRKLNVLSGSGLWIVGAAAFFALALVWRDSTVLNVLDVLALLLTLAVLAMHVRGHRVDLAGIAEYGLLACTAAFNAAFSPFQLILADIGWKTIPRGALSKRGGAVLRGLIIAVPLLLIFGALFVAADSMFEHWVNSFQIRLDLVLSHFLLALVFAWMAAGFLQGVVFGKKMRVASPISRDIFSSNPGATVNPQVVETETSVTENSSALRLGGTEVSVIFGLLNLLFLAFVIIQIRYFFGGASVVQATTGLTYAQYARRGFFELVTVSVLVLPILLFGHWMLQKGNTTAARIYCWLSVTLIALLYVIMASALLRMLVYEREYGLTELRLYTSAFMGWLALVFVWFALTVLRGKRQRFAWGTLAAGLLVMLALHVLNPDSFIVRTNIKHSSEAGKSFDACYNSSLSSDAVPELIADMPAMNPAVRATVAYELLGSSSPVGRADWRTWNLSRWTARKEVRERNAALWQEVFTRTVPDLRCHVQSEPRRQADGED